MIEGNASFFFFLLSVSSLKTEDEYHVGWGLYTYASGGYISQRFNDYLALGVADVDTCCTLDHGIH